MTVDRIAGVLVPVGGEGPEDVVVDGAGTYTGLADGRIVHIVAAGDRVTTMPVAGQSAGGPVVRCGRRKPVVPGSKTGE